MRLNLHQLRAGERFDLPRVSPGDLHVLRGSGRGVQAAVPAGWVSLWCPLSGALSLSAPEGAWTLPSRQAQVWRGSALRCRTVAASHWIGLMAPAVLWESGRMEGGQAVDLLPWQGRLSRHDATLIFALVRSAIAGRHDDADHLFDALGAGLRDRQQHLHALLPLCNGRTSTRRTQTLMRLLRVRHRIECSADVRLDLEELARTASYSPSHLIKVFRAVFNETPSDYAARLREERAWRMVVDTNLPICEITGMVGFESQSAFCRAFKNAFSKTTSEARQAHDASLVE